MKISSILGGAAVVLAGPALALALAGPVAASAHPNATTVCGSNCQVVSGPLLGPDFILNASNVGAAPGAKFAGRIVNLREGSNAATNEDWTVRQVGTLNDFCTRYAGGNGQIGATSYSCVHLGQWSPVFQAQFSPNSVDSGFCAGSKFTPAAGNRIRLVRCGSAKTFFVEDSDTARDGGPTGEYVAIVFAPDRSTSNPLVASVRSFGTHPAHQVVLSREQLTSDDSAINSQLVTRAPLLDGPFVHS